MDLLLWLFVLAPIWGIAAAVIASSKGRSGFAYFLCGFFFNIIGVLIAIGVSKIEPGGDSGWIVCHACPKTRPTNSERCPHCGAGKAEPTDKKKCPACAEWIQPEARKCRFCGEQLGASLTDNPVAPGIEKPEPTRGAD